MTNLVNINPAELIPYARNAKKHDEAQVAKIAGSIRAFGFNAPVLIAPDKSIIVGHGRVLGALKLGLTEIPCRILSHLSDADRRAYILADNRLGELGGGWDTEMLALECAELGELGVDLDGIGLDSASLDSLGLEEEAEAGESSKQTGAGSLAEKFGIPPFSVLNAREGWWQDRKRAWLAIGIKSELGRGGDLIPNGGGAASRERYNGGGSAGRQFAASL